MTQIQWNAGAVLYNPKSAVRLVSVDGPELVLPKAHPMAKPKPAPPPKPLDLRGISDHPLFGQF